MNMIAVVDEKWGIGKNGGLLVHLKGDLKYFKEKTEGKVVVMGRSTLESLPGGKPLPKRKNIVLSRTLSFSEDYKVCNSIKELLETFEKEKTEDIYIIGGEAVYRELMQYCDRFYITKIHGDYDADKFIENLDKRDDLKLTNTSETVFENHTSYEFLIYDMK